jgi:hypothetical protein
MNRRHCKDAYHEQAHVLGNIVDQHVHEREKQWDACVVARCEVIILG